MKGEHRGALFVTFGYPPEMHVPVIWMCTLCLPVGSGGGKGCAGEQLRDSVVGHGLVNHQVMDLPNQTAPQREGLLTTAFGLDIHTAWRSPFPLVPTGPHRRDYHFQNGFDRGGVSKGWLLPGRFPVCNVIYWVGGRHPEIWTAVPDRFWHPMRRACMHPLDVALIHAGVWAKIKPFTRRSCGQPHVDCTPLAVPPLWLVKIWGIHSPARTWAAHLQPGVFGPRCPANGARCSGLEFGGEEIDLCKIGPCLDDLVIFSLAKWPQ